jgi:hypothetical protein
MSDVWWWAAGAAIFVAGVGLGYLPRWLRRRAAARLLRARQLFHLRREWLEAKFLKLAAQHTQPRGLAWNHCEFADEAAFATDRQTRQLRAFVSMSVRFTAVQGGGMEGNPNLQHAKAATAVFLFDGREWFTEGRAVFNLNPLETIERYHHELQMVD